MTAPVPLAVMPDGYAALLTDDMDAELAALEEKLAKARAIKQELLTGRIRLV